MRYSYVLALIFTLAMLSAGQAQDNTLRELLGAQQINCPSIYDSLRSEVLKISAPERKQKIPALLDFWFSYCDASELMIRLQLLSDVAQNEPTPEPQELEAFYKSYLTIFNHFRFPKTDSLLAYSSAWAQDLADKPNLTDHQKFLLDLLQAQSKKQVKEVLYKKEHDDLATTEELRQKISWTDHAFFLELGMSTLFFQGNLASFIRPSPAFSVGVSAQLSPNDYLGFIFRYSALQYKKDFRVYAFNVVTESRGDFAMDFGLTYSRALWKSNRWALHLQSQLAYTSINTGLRRTEIIDGTETETSINVDSYNIASGLEWRWRYHHQNQLGLQFNYHLVNFLAGKRIRSNLEGDQVSLGLSFYF
mgnify:CR=1 FL=1